VNEIQKKEVDTGAMSKNKTALAKATINGIAHGMAMNGVMRH